jgi:light-regulated signal transduction histidine kinase (bacteriophytochrome)
MRGRLLRATRRAGPFRKRRKGARSDADPAQLLLAMAVHELRQPLQVMDSTVKVLLHGLAEPLSSDQHAALDAIQTESHRLHRLTDALEAVAKGPRPASLTSARVDLRARLLASWQENARESADAGVQVDIDAQPNRDWSIRANAQQIDVVVRFLVESAARWARPASRIVIRLRRSRSRVLCTVSYSVDTLARGATPAARRPSSPPAATGGDEVDSMEAELLVAMGITAAHGGYMVGRLRDAIMTLGFTLHDVTPPLRSDPVACGARVA